MAFDDWGFDYDFHRLYDDPYNDEGPNYCKYCGVEIYFEENENGKFVPHNYNNLIIHRCSPFIDFKDFINDRNTIPVETK